jgi:hypothetical protein
MSSDVVGGRCPNFTFGGLLKVKALLLPITTARIRKRTAI